MKTTKSYAEKLRDPRWQRLRLEVMQRAGWECSNCGDRESELQIHHPAYRKGAEPWEYDADELQCLCAKCHKENGDGMMVLREMFLTTEAGPIFQHSLATSGLVDENLFSFARMYAEYIVASGRGFGFSSFGSCETTLMSSALITAGADFKKHCKTEVPQ